jgi:hypothetical protein
MIINSLLSIASSRAPLAPAKINRDRFSSVPFLSEVENGHFPNRNTNPRRFVREHVTIDAHDAPVGTDGQIADRSGQMW